MEKSVNEMAVWPSDGFRYVFFIDIKCGQKYFRIFNMASLKNYIDMEIQEIVDLYPGMLPYISRMDFYFTMDDNIDTAATDYKVIYLNPDWIIRNIKLAETPADADYIVCDIPLQESIKIFSMDNGCINMKDPDKFAEVAKDILEPHRFDKNATDSFNMFTIVHELYHNMFQHQKRSEDFKRHYDYPTTNDRLNIITDQEINSYLLTFCFQNSFEIVDKMGGIDYRKGNPDPQQNVNQEVQNFLYKTASVPLLDCVDDSAGHLTFPDAKDENGNKIMITVYFPKQTFEKMYPYFDEHNLWPPEQPKKKRPGRPMQTQEKNGQTALENQGDPQIYDSGYQDGYKDTALNELLAGYTEYTTGYSEGAKTKIYDIEHNSCQNDPNVIDTKSPGNANESLKFYHRNYGKINESADLNQNSSMDSDDSQPEDSPMSDKSNFQVVQVAPVGDNDGQEGVFSTPDGDDVISSTLIGIGPNGVSMGENPAGQNHTGGAATAVPKHHIVNGYNDSSIPPAPHGYYNRHILLDKSGKPVPVNGGNGSGWTPGNQPVKGGTGNGKVPISIPYGGSQSSDSMEHGLSGDLLSDEDAAKIRKDLGLDDMDPMRTINWQRAIKENGFKDTPLDPDSPLANQEKDNDKKSSNPMDGIKRGSRGLAEVYVATVAPKHHIANGYNGPSVSPPPAGHYYRHILLDKNGKPVPVDAKGGEGGGGTQPVKNGKGGVPSFIPYGGTQSSDSMDHGLSGDMLTPEESAKIRKDLGLDEPSPTAQSDWQRSIKENGFANTPLDPNGTLAKQAKENDAASKGGQGGLSGRQSGGLTEICAAVQESMKSVVNWKRVFIRYLKGAFRNPSTRINKSRLAWEDNYVEYITTPRGGRSTGNVLFFVDESGSISQNQLGQFFKEIRSLKRQIGMVKNIFMVPFAGDNRSLKVLKASVFKNGEVKAPLMSELTGGTDFPDLRYMIQGRIVNKVNMRPLWRSEYANDFPVVTIILTNGEINLPNLQQKYQWRQNRHKLIIFVLNRDERVRDVVKEWAGRNLGSNSFIGISTDDFV